jgi:3-oxoacyl-[acyl-carrier-protein] synthase-3
MDTATAVRRGLYDASLRRRGGQLAVSVAGDTPAPDLAVAAARRALAEAAHRPADFGALLHANVHPQGPDGWSAQHYVNHRTIDRPVTSVEVRNGCVGFFSGLRLAISHLRVVPTHDAVLLTCADNFSTPAVDRWRASRLFVLADAGGAVVVSRRHGFARVLSLTAIAEPALEGRHRAGEPLFPPGITNGGTLNFQERTTRYHQALAGGVGVPDAVPDLLVRTVDSALEQAGISSDDVARVVHDGYTVDALHVLYLDPMGIGADRAIWDFTRHTGHAGPADQIRGLEHVWRDGQVGVGDKVLMVGDAPGMEAACCVLEICATP